MRLSLALSSFAVALAITAPVFALDCPPGSIAKSEGGFDWCEPSVCQNDGQCSPSEVCRPVALCMQVGSLQQDAATLGQAGKRLVVTQRCAPDKKCPDTTTCSEMGRCLGKATAEKMGLLNSAPAPSSSAPTGDASKKSSCGCDVPGTTNGSLAFASVIGVGLVITVRRRRRSPHSR
jgi:MYXO-CTERM domain-containing protein